MKRIKAIAVDSWTGGASNLVRLVAAFEQLDMSLKLIHFGSLGHDKNRPPSESIDNLPVFDVKYYDSRDIYEILKNETPDVVIFLSTEALLHRTVIRYCSILRIPTVHLYHGLIAVQAIETGAPDHYSASALIRTVAERLRKNLFSIIPVYARALVRTRASVQDWWSLARDLISKGLGRYTSQAAADATTTCCLVYAECDFSHANQKYHVPLERIYAVGNPDFEKFGIPSEEFLKGVSSEANAELLYIDHGGATCGLNFSGTSDFIDFLKRLESELARESYRLKVKLHPSHYMTKSAEQVEESGIELSSNETFLEDLKSCCGVIVGPSTASMIPAVLGLPLLLAGFDKFKGQQYGLALVKYPRSYYLDDVSSIPIVLRQFQNRNDDSDCKSWLKRYVGPAPAQMPGRVARIVRDIALSDPSKSGSKICVA